MKFYLSNLMARKKAISQKIIIFVDMQMLNAMENIVFTNKKL